MAASATPLRSAPRPERGLGRLVEAIGAALGVQAPVSVALPLSAGRARAWLYEKGAVLGEEITEDGGTLLTVRANPAVRAHLDRMLRDFADEPS